MTESHAKRVIAKKKARHAIPGRMGSTALRSAIAKAIKMQQNPQSRLTEQQRYNLLMAIENWRKDLKTVEMEYLEASEIVSDAADTN